MFNRNIEIVEKLLDQQKQKIAQEKDRLCELESEFTYISLVKDSNIRLSYLGVFDAKLGKLEAEEIVGAIPYMKKRIEELESRIRSIYILKSF